MSRPTTLALRCIVTEFLSANVTLATEEQVAILAKNDRAQSWAPIAELDRILHEMLLAKEQLIVRWERRLQPIFQWSHHRYPTRLPDFAWLADRLKGRFERTNRFAATVVRPTELLRRLRGDVAAIEIGKETQVFRRLALTDAFLKWDELELHDDDGLEWILLPDPRHQAFAECPVRQPDVALADIFGEATVAIFVGDDHSEAQLGAMHGYLADRKIDYEIW